MNVALIGRTSILITTAKLLINAGHKITLIVTSKAAPEYDVTENDFRSLAFDLSVPFIQSPKISKELISKHISEKQTDIALSINYSGVISDEVVNFFPLGILNAHGGDLPKYRGNACQAWAIINGESRIGLCIHSMIGGELDSGKIITREYLAIDINTRIGQVYTWFEKTIPDLFLKSVELLSMDSGYFLEEQSKDLNDALRCYPRMPEDGKIDWTKSNIEILRLINASSEPYEGAYCFFKDEFVRIYRAEIVSDKENFCAIPGQVCKVSQDDIEVACGEGKLRLLEFSNKGLITSIRARFK